MKKFFAQILFLFFFFVPIASQAQSLSFTNPVYFFTSKVQLDVSTSTDGVYVYSPSPYNGSNPVAYVLPHNRSVNCSFAYLVSNSDEPTICDTFTLDDGAPNLLTGVYTVVFNVNDCTLLSLSACEASMDYEQTLSVVGYLPGVSSSTSVISSSTLQFIDNPSQDVFNGIIIFIITLGLILILVTIVNYRK